MYHQVLSDMQVSSGIIRYHQVSSGIIRYYQVLSGIIRYHQVSSGIIRYHQASSGIIRCHQVSSGVQVSSGIMRTHEGSEKHLDDPVLSVDFPVLHCLGIRSLVTGIGSDHIGRYMSKIHTMPNLRCLVMPCNESDHKI